MFKFIFGPLWGLGALITDKHFQGGMCFGLLVMAAAFAAKYLVNG